MLESKNIDSTKRRIPSCQGLTFFGLFLQLDEVIPRYHLSPDHANHAEAPQMDSFIMAP